MFDYFFLSLSNQDKKKKVIGKCTVDLWQSFISHLRFSLLLILYWIKKKTQSTCATAGRMTWISIYIYILLWTNEFQKKKNQISSLLLVVVLLDRGSIDVIKLIVVFIYIRWHTNELSSCATSFSRCKHRIRLAVEGQTM